MRRSIIHYNLFFVILMCVLFHTASVLAICGSAAIPDNDCDSNELNYSESCCPDGFRVQGVVYNDLKGQDNTDAVGAVCRHVNQGNIEIASDFQNRGDKGEKRPVSYVCESSEVMSGIACKDLPNKDALDGCTAVCKKPNGGERVVYNPDLASNPRAYVKHTVNLPNRIAGMGYKEEKPNSDRADCANVSYKFEPIVQP